MKRLFAFGLVLTAAAAGLVTAVAIAIFIDQQSTSGAVNMASVGEGDTVYICEFALGEALNPILLPSGQTIHCTSDDSGPDEIIFEGDEDLIPGAEKTWDIILWNTSDFPWDIPDFDFDYPNLGKLVDVQITEVSDPGLDCNALPSVDARTRVSGDRVLSDGGGASFDDDSPPNGGALAPSQGYFSESLFVDLIPHVKPGEAQGLRLKAIVDLAVGNECVANEWSISISWSVVAHQ